MLHLIRKADRKRLAFAHLVLASNFADHPDSSVAKHLPDAFHGGKIPLQIAVEADSLLPEALWPFNTTLPVNPVRAIALNDEIPSGMTFGDGSIDVPPAGHG